MANTKLSQQTFVAVLLAGTLVAIADPPTTFPSAVGKVAAVRSAPNEKELATARWWLDLAESELKNVRSPSEHRNAMSGLIRARIAAGDVDGANRLLLEVPKESMELPPLQGAVASETIRQFIAAGQLEKASDVARKMGPSRPFNRGGWADLAVAEARSGDTLSAFRILSTLDKDTAGKAAITAVSELIGDGNLKRAREAADQIGDEFWKQLSIEHIASAEASTGDTDGAIKDVAGLTAQSVRSSACVDVAAAAAAKKDDQGATRIIDSLPSEERPMATRYFAIAKLDRGDPSAAIKTADQIGGNDREIFWHTFAEDSVRLGYTDVAIKVLQDKWEPVALATTFNAMLKYQRLDAARSMLAMLPEGSSWEGFDYVAYKISGERRLAGALANKDQLDAAKKLFADADADAVKHPPHQRDPSQEETKLAIAAAELRAGHMEFYNRARQPYVDAAKAAVGGASQRDAHGALITFDFATHNIPEVERDLQNADADETAEITYGIGFTLLDPTLNGDRPRYLAEDRQLLTLVLRNPKIGQKALLITVAGWHAGQSKLDDWFNWSRTLPAPETRLNAFVAAALSLRPELKMDY